MLRLVLHPFAGKDFHLLRLASEKPFDRDESFEGLFLQIEDWLARAGRDGGWPYRGCIRSWITLRRIRTRLQLECGSEDPFETYYPDAEFREPPLSAENAQKRFDLEVAPLNTSRLLEEESRLMSNCAATYTPVISTMEELFLYRIAAPFRATLLVQRVEGEWAISQLYGPANSEVEESERKLVESWLQWENGRIHS